MRADLAISYRAAVERLYALGHELHFPSDPAAGDAQAQMARKFDLAHMRVLLAAVGEPQRRFRSVLVAGTNGKGSTAATLAAILQAAGHRTGLYTSPHLLRINERIRIDGEEIGDDDFAQLYERVDAAAGRLLAHGELPWHPSFFETLTAMAFLHFARVPAELAVLEVGMGGRLDATNVVEPLVSVITDIALDHQKFLGQTIHEIAGEKAGIIRAGGLVITLPQHPEANAVIGATVQERGAKLVSAAAYVPHESAVAQGARSLYELEVLGERIVVDSPLYGRHQRRNLALAIAAAEQLQRLGTGISARAIETGLRQTRWPGRFQVLPPSLEDDWPETVLDVAHNPAGAWALRAALSEQYGKPGTERPLVLVFGVMGDKAVEEIAEVLFPLAQHVVATHANHPRSAMVEEIRAAGERICTSISGENSVAAAIERARSLAGDQGVVVITGSIYVVGEAMAALKCSAGVHAAGP